MEENNNKSAEDTRKEIDTPRENIINTAVKFLQNPNVQKSSLAHRQAFLKRKGLTEEEIQIACERAGTVGNNGLQTMLQSRPLPPATYLVPRPTLWSRTRDVLNTAAIIGGVTYGLYLLYKKYIEPFLFGIEREQKSIQDYISEIHESLKKVHADLQKLSEEQRQQPEHNNATRKQIQELKAEIATVKGLLLSRHQFPAATPTNPIVPPSIPAWQLSSFPQASDGDEGEQGQKGEGDSGSGSSGNEVVTNTGSDSSLEMIRE